MPKPRTRRAEPTNALQELIDQIRYSYSPPLSDRAIEERSGLRPDGRPGVGRSNVGKMRTQALRRSPDRGTLIGLAAGLGVTTEMVEAAVGKTLGYRETLQGTAYSQAHAYADRIDRLPVARQGFILQVIRDLLAAGEIGEAGVTRDHDKVAADAEKRAQRMGEIGRELKDLADGASPADIAAAKKAAEEGLGDDDPDVR